MMNQGLEIKACPILFKIDTSLGNTTAVFLGDSNTNLFDPKEND